MSAAYDTYNYPRYWTQRNYEHESENIVIKEYLSKIKQPKNIIDIGCGFGRLLPFYENKKANMTLVDPSNSLLKIAQKNYKDKKNCVYVKSTVQDLTKNTKKKKFDLAICVRVFHHVENIDQALGEIDNILEKNGYLILEFANKLHGKAVFKNFAKGNFTFPLDITAIDRRSKQNIKKNSILFLNHHPDVVKQKLEEHGFKILEKRSVSNFRYKLIKDMVPLNILLKLEEMTQGFLSKINFGPSIFVLAQKK